MAECEFKIGQTIVVDYRLFLAQRARYGRSNTIITFCRRLLYQMRRKKNNNNKLSSRTQDSLSLEYETRFHFPEMALESVHQQERKCSNCLAYSDSFWESDDVNFQAPFRRLVLPLHKLQHRFVASHRKYFIYSPTHEGPRPTFQKLRDSLRLYNLDTHHTHRHLDYGLLGTIMMQRGQIIQHLHMRYRKVASFLPSFTNVPTDIGGLV